MSELCPECGEASGHLRACSRRITWLDARVAELEERERIGFATAMGEAIGADAVWTRVEEQAAALKKVEAECDRLAAESAGVVAGRCDGCAPIIPEALEPRTCLYQAAREMADAFENYDALDRQGTVGEDGDILDAACIAYRKACEAVPS